MAVYKVVVTRYRYLVYGLLVFTQSNKKMPSTSPFHNHPIAQYFGQQWGYPVII
jgi:hypothetical protein